MDIFLHSIIGVLSLTFSSRRGQFSCYQNSALLTVRYMNYTCRFHTRNRFLNEAQDYHLVNKKDDFLFI